MTQVPTSRWLNTVVFVSALFLTAADAGAQGFVSPLIGYNFGGDAGCPEITNCEEKRINYGVAFGALNNVFGVEQEIAFANDFFGEAPGVSSSVLTVMTNWMVAPNLKVARPYFTMGIGLIKTDFELTPFSLLSTNNNNFGWDIGGGLMIFFGDHFGVRGDIRHFHTFNEIEALQQLEQFGISFGGTKLDFGRAAAAVVIKF